MKTVNYVIVEVDETYLNELQLASGTKLTINTSIENVSHINRKAKVLSAPGFTTLQEGDDVIIHHNILRYRNGYHGKLVPSNYWLEDNKFFVPLTEIFAYRRGGDWESLDPYCFIKPIKSKLEKKIGKFSLSDSAFKDKVHKGNEKLRGEVVYGNKTLSSWGIGKGDVIVFSPWSEYEFNFEGDIYYRMKTRDIKIKLNERTK